MNLPKKDMSGQNGWRLKGWRDGSAGEVLAAQARGPEFGPTKVGVIACDCHPSIEEAEIDRFLGLANQPSANQPLVSPRAQ